MSTRTDNFNRANEDPILTPSDPESNWVVETGDVKVDTNQAASASSGTATLGSASTDGDVQADLPTLAGSGNYLGVVGRFTDTLHNLTFTANHTSSYNLTQYTGGGGTTLFSGGFPAPGDTIKMVCTGSTVDLYVNGSLLAGGITTSLTSAGRWGIVFSNSVGRMDNFVYNFTPLPDTGSGSAPFSFTASAGAIVADTTSGSAPFSFTASAGGVADVTQIQSIVVEGAIGGTWTETFDNIPGGGNPQTTAPIAYNANAAAVKSALEALSNVASVSVTGLGTVASPFLVEFLDSDLDYDAMTADFSGLVSGTEWVFWGAEETEPPLVSDMNNDFVEVYIRNPPGADLSARVTRQDFLRKVESFTGDVGFSQRDLSNVLEAFVGIGGTGACSMENPGGKSVFMSDSVASVALDGVGNYSAVDLVSLVINMIGFPNVIGITSGGTVSINFVAITPTDWNISPPTDVWDALQRIAARIKAISGTGP